MVIELFLVFPYFLFDVYRNYLDIPSLIPKISNWCLLLYFSLLDWLLLYEVFFFNLFKKLFDSFDILYCISVFNILGSAPYNALPSACFAFNLSYACFLRLDY